MSLGKFTINIAKGKPKVKRVSSSIKLSKLVKAKIVLDDDAIYKAYIELPASINELPDILSIPLTEKSYNLKGKQYIFTKKKDKDNRYVCIVRTKQHAEHFPNSPVIYSSVMPGLIVKGYIVRNSGNLEFELKDIISFNEYSTPINTILDEEDEYIKNQSS